MNKERLLQINNRVSNINLTNEFVKYCRELIAAVEELQAENEQLRDGVIGAYLKREKEE